MPLRHASLRRLRVFEAVARHRSCSRAAAELHLTQPAVSMQVRQLVEEIGLSLIEQMGRRLDVTRAGREIVACARAVSERLREAEEALAALKGTGGGELSIAVTSTAKYFAPRLLAEFRRSPALKTRIIRKTYQPLRQAHQNPPLGCFGGECQPILTLTRPSRISSRNRSGRQSLRRILDIST